jgi:hypothetical protein
MSEIIFEVQEDEVDGGYVATALGTPSLPRVTLSASCARMVRDAVRCHFGNGAPGPMPKIIRIHFIRDEVIAG